MNCKAGGIAADSCGVNLFNCYATQGYDWVSKCINTSGALTNVVGYTPGQPVNVKVQIRIPCCGQPYPTNAIQPTAVTFYAIAKSDFFATTTSIATANWIAIGQGTFLEKKRRSLAKLFRPRNVSASGLCGLLFDSSVLKFIAQSCIRFI